VTTKDIVEEIAKVPLFFGCSSRELQAIARAVKEIDHKAGTVIAREGDPGIGLFIIASGKAEVSIGGKKKSALGKGEFFGEIALLDGGPRTATVTATTPVRLYGLT
jgi:CRP-like cAMP-binding protein